MTPHTETLIELMGAEANTAGIISSYVAYLIHDAATIKDAKAGDVYYWIFRSDDRGTWIVRKGSDYFVPVLATGAKAVYEITVVQTGTGWAYPTGHIKKLNFSLEYTEKNKLPTVVFKQ